MSREMKPLLRIINILCVSPKVLLCVVWMIEILFRGNSLLNDVLLVHKICRHWFQTVSCCFRETMLSTDYLAFKRFVRSFSFGGNLAVSCSCRQCNDSDRKPKDESLSLTSEYLLRVHSKMSITNVPMKMKNIFHLNAYLLKKTLTKVDNQTYRISLFLHYFKLPCSAH